MPLRSAPFSSCSRNETRPLADSSSSTLRPSIVSALLSGVLLNCAFLAILRGHSLLVKAGLGSFSQDLLVLFGLLEVRQKSPMFDLSLFRIPTFAGAQITAFAISAGMFAQFLFLSIYLENVIGNSAVRTGVIFLPLSLVSFVVAPLAGRFSARFPVRWFLGGGLALTGVALLLMHGLTLSSTASALVPGFVIGGIGVGMVNAPLAATAVSVVAPQRAGMASGINNTFRQVGIATGIAALGAIFQSRITAHLATTRMGSQLGPIDLHAWSQAIASGNTSYQPNAFGDVHQLPSVNEVVAAESSFIAGLNSILLVAAFVLFAGAILAFFLIREKDFVASGPAVAGH